MNSVINRDLGKPTSSYRIRDSRRTDHDAYRKGLHGRTPGASAGFQATSSMSAVWRLGRYSEPLTSSKRRRPDVAKAAIR